MAPRRKVLILTIASATILTIIGFNLWIFSPYIIPQEHQPASYQIQGVEVNDICYLLQYEEYETKSGAINAIASAEHDIFILEAFIEDQIWSPTDLTQMKANGRTDLIFAYMSIGEAETYRYYWEESWDSDNDGNPDSGAPTWLDIENPEWEGNYKVKYWEDDWQDVIFSTPESYLDRLLSAGFDGAYLDIIDAYEYYEEQGIENADRLMVDFVGNLSHYAKQIKPEFQIIPQNGENLVLLDDYLDMIDGIGREDLRFNGNSRQDSEETAYALQMLQFYTNAGKYVFQFEYATLPVHVQNSYHYAQDSGFICYNGPRELDKIQEYSFISPD